MENINITNKGKDILLANKPRIVPWRTKRMPQSIQKHSRVTLHRSTHPKWKKEQTKKSSDGQDRLPKSIWYGSAKLDNKISQNVHNITQSRKLHRNSHEKLDSWINSRRKKLDWNKNPQRYFPRRYTVTPTIYICHNATKPHTQIMHGRIQTL